MSMTGKAILNIIEEHGPQTEEQLCARLMAPAADVRNALAHLIFDEGLATCKMGVFAGETRAGEVRRPVFLAEPPSDAFMAASP